MRNFIIFLVLGLVVMPAAAQRLASYDVQSAGAELAGRRCAPMGPAMAFTQPLPHPAPVGVQWFHGAIASANQTQRLYYANGPAGQGIQRLPWSLIGAAGAVPVSFAAPPGFNQITGMVVDPTDATGRRLYVIDGFSIVLYRAPGLGQPAALLGGPWAWPGAGGNSNLTGLTFDPWAGVVVATDQASRRWTFDPVTSTWAAGFVAPAVAVPMQATGIQMCLVSGATFISYAGGTVMNPDTGVVLAFPAAPGGGVRSHEGLTYFGQPVGLGGGIPGGPCLNIGQAPWEGNQAFELEIDPKGGGNVWVGIQTGPQSTPVQTPYGTLHIDPAQAMLIDLGNHTTTALVPLPLPTGALGTEAVIQAMVIRPNGEIQLSDGMWGQLFTLN